MTVDDAVKAQEQKLEKLNDYISKLSTVKYENCSKEDLWDAVIRTRDFTLDMCGTIVSYLMEKEEKSNSKTKKWNDERWD